MSLIPDSLQRGEWVAILIKGEVRDVNRSIGGLFVGEDWVYPDQLVRNGADVIVEKIEPPFTPPPRSALFVSSAAPRCVYASAGDTGYVIVRTTDGRITGSRLDDLLGTWEQCDRKWRDGITVIGGTTP